MLLQGFMVVVFGVGDCVWFWYVKSGELVECIDWYYLVLGDEVVDELLIYCGEGKVFL